MNEKNAKPDFNEVIDDGSVSPAMKQVLAGLLAAQFEVTIAEKNRKEADDKINKEKAKCDEYIVKAIALIEEGKTTGDVILDYLLTARVQGLLEPGNDVYKTYEQLAVRIKENIGKPILIVQVRTPHGIPALWPRPMTDPFGDSMMKFDIQLGVVASGDLKLTCSDNIDAQADNIEEQVKKWRLFAVVDNLLEVREFMPFSNDMYLPQDGRRIYLVNWRYCICNAAEIECLQENKSYVYFGVAEVRQFINVYLACSWRGDLVSQLEAWLDTYSIAVMDSIMDQGKNDQSE